MADIHESIAAGKLFRAVAMCKRNQLAVVLTPDNREFLALMSDPMSAAECDRWNTVSFSVVEDPSWRFFVVEDDGHEEAIAKIKREWK